MRPGEFVVAIASEKVADVITMQATLTRHNPGERIDLTIRRGDSTHTVSLVLKELATE